jgi:putative transcriptional regulator
VTSPSPTATGFHLPEEGLFRHATGISSEAATLAIACHLEGCVRCREETAACDEIGAHLLATLPAVPLDPGLRPRLLAELTPQSSFVPPPRIEVPGLPSPPEALQPYLARARIRWRMLVPGAHAIELPLRQRSATARLMRFRAGFVIPLHDHAGPEYTVILSGSLEDTGSRAQAGDVVYREPGMQHVQRITDDEECVAVVVNEGALVPMTWKGRLLRIITGV